jgi:hypothetical protein
MRHDVHRETYRFRRKAAQPRQEAPGNRLNGQVLRAPETTLTSLYKLRE